MTVRVRFAPSPTGPLHIGGVRTALYNYLFAKKNGGSFILRIEDTDQTRYVEGAEEYINQAMKWCGFSPDEGVNEGGEFGPYRQSERKDIYRQYAQQLIDEDKAYYAFDTPEELDAMRERLKEARVANPQYNAFVRMQMNNSLTLSPEEVQAKIDAGEPYVIRIKLPRNEDIRFRDEVRDWVVVNTATLDDKVLMKSDGMPTYHLANIVDDHLMQITHVIRGEEWLPSAPLHVKLYECFGWEPPIFAHLPLILKPDGNGKLSKRAGDKLGIPVFPIPWTDPSSEESFMSFQEEGFLPEALVNILAFLGWNPGTEQELFSLAELVESFKLDRINKAGARFDIEKAKWFNQQYLKALADAVLGEMLMKELNAQEISASQELTTKIAVALKERVVFVREMVESGRFFFEAPENYDEKTVRKKWTAVATQVLTDYASELSAQTSVTSEQAKEIMMNVVAKDEVPLGRVMPALRLALTGGAGGPDLMDIVHILGPKEVSSRIHHALEQLKDQVKA